MNRTRKYPKTEGYWVYIHTTPDGMQYIGMSQRQPNRRWHPLEYKETALGQYIERFGWENIEHKVLIDNLTKAQAEQWEDRLITALSMNGMCINERRSGGYCRDNRKEYYKAYNKARREQKKEYNKAYYKTHKEQYNEYNKQRLSTPEGKIYNRVKAYNQRHPDKTIETPMEARTKYLETGYIPNYVKNHDLIESK